MLNQDMLRTIVNNGISNIDGTQYFKKKGFSNNTIERYKLGFLPNGLLDYAEFVHEDVNVLECYKYVIPDIKEDHIINYIQFRSDKATEAINLSFELDSTYIIGDNGKKLWNDNCLYRTDKHPVIFIAETWTDALSMEEMGYSAIALNRIHNVLTLWKKCKTIENIRNTRFISICDNDFYGRKSNNNVTKMFESIGCRVSVFDRFLEDIKDCNEWLQSNRHEFEETIKKFLKSECGGV